MKVLFRGYNPNCNGVPRHTCISDDFQSFDFDSVKDLNLTYSFSLLLTERNVSIANFCVNHPNLTVLSNDDSFIRVSGCNNKLILLNEKGELHKVICFEKSGIVEYDVQPVTRFLHSENDKVAEVACHAKINVALSCAGKLFRIPSEVGCDNIKIKDIVVGREHCVVLDEAGGVYTFGCGSRGQLGHGTLENEETPTLIKALDGIKIAAIAAGGWHSCALSEEGDLYTWGWNSNGQLGIGDQYSVMATPHVVDFEDDQGNVARIACGTRHTIALLDTNKLYGCGWNKYKQILCEEKENVFVMVPCYNFSSFCVVKLVCGPFNSAVVCK